jgi:hypothetical protein
VFGITVANHHTAAKAAKQSVAIKALAEKPLTDVLKRLDEGMDVNACETLQPR